MRALRIEGLGVLIDEGYTLTAYCGSWIGGKTCGHNLQLDLEYLASRLGRDHSTLHKNLVPKLKCSKCGAKGTPGNDSPISLKLSPPFKLMDNGAEKWGKPLS